MQCPMCEGTMLLNVKNGLAFCPVCGGYYISPDQIVETDEDKEIFLKWIDKLINNYANNKKEKRQYDGELSISP